MLRNSPHTLPALLCLGLLCLTLLALPATAAPQADPDQEIDLSLRRADLVTVLESFAAIAGGSLDAGPAVAGTVTIELNSVPWRRALDQLCRLNTLSCYWSDSDGPELVVRRSDGGFQGSGQSISISLRAADLQQTLLTMSAMAGDFALEVDPALAGEVSINLESTPWPEALEEICRNAGCVVTWGERSATVGTLAPDATVLQGAGYPPAELWVDPALTRELPDLSQRIEALRASSVRQPVAAFDELCEEADCTWAVHWGATPRLRFEPRPEPGPEQARVPRVSTLPIFGVQPIAVQVSLDNAAGTFASHDLQFDWGHPARRVGYDTEEGTAWLTLTWLPFSPDRQLLLPSVVHCDRDGAARRVSVFDPLTLPLDEPWSDLEDAVGLTIRSLPTDRDPAAAVRSAPEETRPSCLDTEVRLNFELSNLAEGGTSKTSTPHTQPGNFLMIRPPASEDSDPLAALVYVATTGEIDVVAQVMPGDDEIQPEVRKMEISGYWSMRMRFGGPDEAGYLVEVRAGDAPAD